MSLCANCGTENRAEASFCSSCGSPLERLCPNGHPVGTEARFCDRCGAALEEQATSESPAPAAAVEAPVAERRLVSVLFADLVGFTTVSESRDSEEVRELLSRYFELSRDLIALYGGTVEKFIGDAVMAVWGTPTATEDDAERAVRAALDLVASVPELDPALQARAGVLTGEAAVTIGAQGEGMVAGDLVNTAARIQSTADPGAVLTGESTRRATERAIAYEEAGVHELKGKVEPVQLHRALRVVSGVGGELRSVGLEAPFVGRQRELKLIKDIFHACAHDSRAHLVSVTGIAGIGKSRVAWEFYKYFDGIVDTVWWHRGRCLAYGEGVAYWALADMVRMRCRIAEDEDPRSARQKLEVTLHEHLLDAEERSFVEPRLAHLLGLEEGLSADRQDLFAAWRLFFERLADSNPVVLAFEDMQWADTSLLDFVEYLLEWSRDHPLYVITLARPELHERRPSWGAGQRNFTSLYLEPLSRDAMNALLEGLVPGLPDQLTGQILARAEGVPLYAVETVRMLLDRGLLTQDGPVYRPAGDIETLEVPETLHALIAARLDGLSTDERRLLQDGSVLGKTFSAGALSELSGLSGQELEPFLSSLVRKEVLGVQSDPRSPEHGQYGFLQDLVRHVAYETLSKRERKIRHLAAAGHLQSAFPDEDEVAEVLASHYLAAHEAAPDADDAPEIRDRAREMLSRAGERAASLGAPDEGQRYFEQAAGLTEDPAAEAALLEQAGRLAAPAGRLAEGRERLERAIALYQEAGDASSAALASAGLGDVDVLEGRLEEAKARLEATLPTLEQKGASPELATTLAQLGRVQALRGEREPALLILERALQLAERLGLEEVFVQALTSRAVGVGRQGRLAETRMLLGAAMNLARDREFHTAWFRAAGNLAVVLQDAELYTEFLDLCTASEVRANQLGDREQLAQNRLGVAGVFVAIGRWDEAIALEAEADRMSAGHFARGELATLARIHCERGALDAAQKTLESYEWARGAEQMEFVPMIYSCDARFLRGKGQAAEALALAERGLAFRDQLPFINTYIKICLIEALESTLVLGDLARSEELLANIESLLPGETTPSLRGQGARFRALVDARHGREEGVHDNFLAAQAIFRETGLVFDLAVTQLEHAEWLTGHGRVDEAEPVLEEARLIFERLEAHPWLERVDAAAAAAPAKVPA